MAISTYKTFLMYKEHGEGGSYEKLIDIKEVPNLGGTPEMLETTTLSNGSQTFIPGIQTLESMDFTANYDKADFKKVKDMEGTEYDFAVWFGGTSGGSVAVPDGSEGKFEFSGKLSVFTQGGGVNEVVSMTISIAPSTDIVFKQS